MADYAPPLIFPRLLLWLTLPGPLGPEDETLLRRQLAFAFAANPGWTMTLAGRTGRLSQVRSQLELAAVPQEDINRYFPVPLAPGAGPER